MQPQCVTVHGRKLKILEKHSLRGRRRRGGGREKNERAKCVSSREPLYGLSLPLYGLPRRLRKT